MSAEQDKVAVDYAGMKDKYAEAKNEIDDFVKKNPWASVAIAVGIGYLLARIFSGRKE